MKNLRTDPMWDELKYKLTHPETEEEQRAREIKEKTYRESILKRIFGDNEDGVITGGAAPIGAKEYWDKNGKVYWGDSNGNRLPDTKNYLEKFTNKAKAIASNVSDVINETNPNHPSYKQKTNILVSAAMLLYMPETMLSKTVASKLAPNAGRKIAQSIAQGINGGAIGGAAEGAIRSIQEEKNPIKTIAQDSALGAVGGALGGGLSNYAGKVINQKTMDKFASKIKQAGNSLKSLSRDEKKAYFNLGKKYYQNYEQGVDTYADTIGKVKLNSDAIKETNIQSPHLTKDVVNLSKNIKNAKYVGPEQEIHPHKKYDIERFHRLNGDGADYIIAENTKGDNYFYKIADPNLTGPKPEGQDLPSSIIPNILPKLKSFSEWIEELRRNRGD